MYNKKVYDWFNCVLRAIHDVKATDMGLSTVRFKAEVDFDGRVVTRSYLEKQDIDQILNVRTEIVHSLHCFYCWGYCQKSGVAVKV